MANKKIILFGKTGSGKSTVANALATGGSGGVVFRSSAGFRGCTSTIQLGTYRGWEIVDTVGLGESTAGAVSSENAQNKVLTFLKSVNSSYSHIVYVKSGEERFDAVDKKIWETFESIFEGAKDSFIVLITHRDKRWLDLEFNSLPEWIKKLDRGKILVTNILPPDDDREMEKDIGPIRQRAIEKLEHDLTKLFEDRESKYSTPNIAGMDDSALRVVARDILDFLLKTVRVMMGPLSIALGIGRYDSIFNAFISMFM